MRVRFLVSCAAVAALASTTAANAVVPQPYGANDAGGFRNVLPPGQRGLVTAVDLTTSLSGGPPPEHFADQQPLYENLLYASPTLTHAQASEFYKDATFGVPDAQVANSISPRAGVVILRDRDYGVPHIYGDTRGDVMFGAGYAGAQDRLFLMDVLRHTGRAQLSSFVGGSAGNRAMDRTQWEIAPYTEADLQRQYDDAAKVYGAAGQRVADDVKDYVAGINQYISDLGSNGFERPAEYTALGKEPEPWKITDVIATASLIGGIFGKGGGGEIQNALAAQAFVDRFGAKKGRKRWADFRSKEDPEAPVTVSQRFPYETGPAFAKRGLAFPDKGSVKLAPSGGSLRAAPRSFGSSGFAGLGEALHRALTSGPGHASNWLLVSARESANGHPVAVMGPQVGYYVPQILMEEDLHGPGIEARGATFPGVNLYVQLGHGRDYAWSATTATSDNVDTFAEVLCQDDTHYLYKGECRAMEKLVRTNSWSPNLSDMTPAGTETLTVYRTVHGIVSARGTVKGRKVAFVIARTTYFHEADSALGFAELNDPGAITDAKAFQRAAEKINFAFNWAYVDANDIAYFCSGWYPQRATGVTTDFPVLGTGEYDWKDFNPDAHTMRVLPFKSHPQAINPPYLLSWNGKQAPRWAAADDNYAYGPLQRMGMLRNFVTHAIAGPKKITLEQLVQADIEPATQDIRGVFLTPLLLKAVGTPPDEPSRAALATLKAWHDAGSHRRDLDKDGRYENDDAVTLMDAWWPKLVAAEFEPVLGTDASAAVQRLLPFADPVGGQGSAPAFFGGWWGYVSKDLRTLFNKRNPRGRMSRVYCGGGRRGRCRQVLQASLREALKVTRADLYGHASDCADNAQASCFDRNRPTVASGVSLPPFPFQNRPTFQQTVELTQKLPR